MYTRYLLLRTVKYDYQFHRTPEPFNTHLGSRSEGFTTRIVDCPRLTNHIITANESAGRSYLPINVSLKSITAVILVNIRSCIVMKYG